ncbi:hypothetical protein K504DRAFT_470599 [Pleomassaria siparia CBS 279.74]|uniref:Tr-type G domain-containing protein n=1 Tax=Pleomassaria siparia CBS 279.74 TaxID=1314801 RepID=A0A6G1K3R9_9PLEO|nr:hypothetical protein K504DRAFT_470599 [Pleomassaria siparia CBS 279.74]
MASIFTFQPDPPRVSSPWSTPPPGSQPRQSIPQESASDPPLPAIDWQAATTNANTLAVDYSTVERLEAEPQEGPTEYKLHLLLRSRRSSPPSVAIPSRQHRLEQLTTQLLWRLQQSCPYHLSSNSLVVPHFPTESELAAPAPPQRLLPNLEESRGALYEIGVADDGTFVGLVHDEMEESLNNLRAMAASLGCRVDVLRMVCVGETQTEKLWVVEAFVHPGRHNDAAAADMASLDHSTDDDHQTLPQQVRVSLTGATLSGKSSLLGTLSTATLDNGRGKSRLSLLKHRHEIISGMTSSVTQELIGYHDVVDHQGTRTSTQVISYGVGNVSSWADIHSSAEDGRLVFISDSAGHPRFLRTTIRGLVGWDPHWTLLCIPADESSGRNSASTSPESDLWQAYLQLCINLELPLVVVITKYDLATKATLRQILSKLLTPLKDTGRKPCIMPSNVVDGADLNTILPVDLHQADEIVQTLRESSLTAVPIIFTSAVTGTGINALHAFLRELPLPAFRVPSTNIPRTLFYVEDVYSSRATASRSISPSNGSPDQSAIIGGHVRYGTLSIGDELFLGPYPTDTGSDDSDGSSGRASIQNSLAPKSRSFPGALHNPQSGFHPSTRPGAFANDKHAEWRKVRITSLRNLRLPVRTLHAGQVGTMGVLPVDLPIASPAVDRIRKGMVLQSGGAKANRVLSVRFGGADAAAVTSLTVGSAVVIYVASVRASAKVVSVAAEAFPRIPSLGVPEEEEEDGDDAGFGFGFGFDNEDTPSGASTGASQASATVVTFQFIASREFVEMDAKVLVLPGGGPGLSGGTERGEKGVAGLEGFVGRVIEET